MPLSTWKIHERIAKASEIRMPIDAGSSMNTSMNISRIGPAMTRPSTAGYGPSG